MLSIKHHLSWIDSSCIYSEQLVCASRPRLEMNKNVIKNGICVLECVCGSCCDGFDRLITCPVHQNYSSCTTRVADDLVMTVRLDKYSQYNDL
jgi:hypothetical protein